MVLTWDQLFATHLLFASPDSFFISFSISPFLSLFTSFHSSLPEKGRWSLWVQNQCTLLTVRGLGRILQVRRMLVGYLFLRSLLGLLQSVCISVPIITALVGWVLGTFPYRYLYWIPGTVSLFPLQQEYQVLPIVARPFLTVFPYTYP